MSNVNTIVDAAIRRVLAARPVPSVVSVGEAARMLKVTPRTIHRMNPPRAAGKKIPYSWILKRLDPETNEPL